MKMAYYPLLPHNILDDLILSIPLHDNIMSSYHGLYNLYKTITDNEIVIDIMKYSRK